MGSSIDFDYIIVGSGSAGCVLANRLTARGTSKVLSKFWIHILAPPT
ncbi:MAG: hypothetical protein GKS00_05925 [Alphaproteobacteria bacterium]|nr:hypothetical protein [Alphaproteobacteria bacterium]